MANNGFPQETDPRTGTSTMSALKLSTGNFFYNFQKSHSSFLYNLFQSIKDIIRLTGTRRFITKIYH